MTKQLSLIKVLNYKFFAVLGLFLLLSFSIFNYLNIKKLKKENSDLNNLLNKTVKLLTPSPTKKLTPTPSPTPTPKPILSEYVFIPLPHSGIVYSCKRSSENIVREASLFVKSATDERLDCIKNYICKDNCDSKDISCQTNCISSKSKECSQKLNEASSKLLEVLKDYCIGGSNSQNGQTLHAAP